MKIYNKNTKIKTSFAIDLIQHTLMESVIDETIGINPC